MNYDLNSLALLMRDWADDPLLAEHSLVTVLITENLNDLHPLLVNNPRTAKIKVPLPLTPEIADAVAVGAPRFPKALAQYQSDARRNPRRATHGRHAKRHRQPFQAQGSRDESLQPADLVKLKKQLVEHDARASSNSSRRKRTLDDLHGQEKLKTWLRQDIALWRAGRPASALPMGYLTCGPVGTGKTYLVECLAGEAGVPVVKLKNFRDSWVGSTEGNLEKIFRLLQALGRCLVFIDEADQALGKRDSGSQRLAASPAASTR